MTKKKASDVGALSSTMAPIGDAVRILASITYLTLAAPAFGQLTASQAPTPAPQQATELCPLQLDVDLTKATAAGGQSFLKMPEKGGIVMPSGRYVCDKARVQSITVRKEKDRNREVLLNVSALLSTEYVRQDVNLTIQLLVNGEVKQTEQWRSLTIGTNEGAAGYIPFGGSSPKVREGKWWIKRVDFDNWFGEGSKLSG
jgi:hypothetical protein